MQPLDLLTNQLRELMNNFAREPSLELSNLIKIYVEAITKLSEDKEPF